MADPLVKKPTTPSPHDRNDQNAQQESILSRSAHGATFLILLQIASRALTFGVNQVLLRYLSPELLGISAQLELYLITVLTFSRESLRVALQRQGDTSKVQKEVANNTAATDGNAVEQPMGSPPSPGSALARPRGYIDEDTPAGQTQTVINLSYLSIYFGIPFAFLLAHLYRRRGDPAVLATPHFQESLNLMGVAAFIELLTEPCFAVVQQKMLYKTRATAESAATLIKCFVTCAVAFAGARNGKEVGVLPFALGQWCGAVAMFVVYYWGVWGISSTRGFALSATPIYSRVPSKYILNYLSRPLLTLTGNLLLQSSLKHILTQGDTLLITALTSPFDQGIYALVSNYGGLIARVLFQPIEESSRSLFAKLVARPNASTQKPSLDAVRSTTGVLTTFVKLYLLLAIFACALGPATAPTLLSVLLGPRWLRSGAGDALSVYCYYIPLLALNGITEAFISAVASPAELRGQTVWMTGFSAGYAAAGWLFLRRLRWGAQGLVWAGCVNMGMRILWATWFISGWVKRMGKEGVGWVGVLPKAGSVASGAVAGAILLRLEDGFTGGLGDLVKCGWVGVGLVGVILFFERDYLLQYYRLLRPKSEPGCTEKKMDEKKEL